MTAFAGLRSCLERPVLAGSCLMRDAALDPYQPVTNGKCLPGDFPKTKTSVENR